MLKRTGNAKLIDIGSAYEFANGTRARTCTPSYAAPEVLEGEGGSCQADLASLGYVLVEMLAGAAPFAGISDRDALIDAKKTILDRVPHTLPEEVVCNELLMNLIGGLIALKLPTVSPAPRPPTWSSRARRTFTASSFTATSPASTRTRFASGFKNWIDAPPTGFSRRPLPLDARARHNPCHGGGRDRTTLTAKRRSPEPAVSRRHSSCTGRHETRGYEIPTTRPDRP